MEPKYRRSDIEYFRKFSPNNHDTVNDKSWVSDHPFVPQGWKLREVKINGSDMFRYLSPDGYDLLGKAAALKFLIDKEYPEAEIQEMRDTMKYEGWWSDPGLPRHWLYRAGAGAQVFLLSSAGENFVRTEAALDWARRAGTREDLWRLERFIREIRVQADQ